MFGIFELHYGVKLFSIAGAVLGFLAVGAGAFGGHALKNLLSKDMLSVYEVGVRYQMYHALVLFAVAWACDHFTNTLLIASGWFFISGIVLFSGSLYALVLTGLNALGAITPIGGALLMLGWFTLAVGIFRG